LSEKAALDGGPNIQRIVVDFARLKLRSGEVPGTDMLGIAMSQD
jgi:hypothetical protein